MKLVKPQEFTSIIKNCSLLLDTNIFIDTLLHPVQFADFFAELKNNGCTLLTVEAVKIEFLKGTLDDYKVKEKKQVMDVVLDAYFPVDSRVYEKVNDLIKLYKQEGSKVSVTDYLLGGSIACEIDNLLLVTKNVNDFPTNIFELKTYFHLLHRKSIHNYGVFAFRG